MYTRPYLRFVSLLLVISSLLAKIILVQAAVTLISFDAIPDIPNQKITLLWETGSELDFAGFYIQRSFNPDTGFERLLDLNGDPLFFPAKGEGGAGAQYSYDDTDVNMGVFYYYRLEMLDLGSFSVYSFVVSAILANQFYLYLPLIQK
jgi:hypothetical protein